MHLNDEPLSLYDVLELTPDATPQEIRSAYLRLKSSYSKDNIAHYTVFSREETETMLQNIENAYLTLSNPERRKAYDRGQGHSEAPSQGMTGFPTHGHSPQAPSTPVNAAPHDSYNSSSLLGQTFAGGTASAAAGPSNARFNPGIESSFTDLDTIIQNETDWSGAALRRVREAKRISLEDLSDYTRISRTYLQALEEEDFARLPAIVYVRGFLQQVGKRLKLPVETITPAYLLRLKNARPDK
ncbi:MAG: helix-turn-helix domain-containing protein [Bdellovibrionales bacterium]|nr:helix-turn-helix domain-containing protein [Oligoflexia bacterium]